MEIMEYIPYFNNLGYLFWFWLMMQIQSLRKASPDKTPDLLARVCPRGARGAVAPILN